MMFTVIQGDPNCTKCLLHQGVEKVCELGHGMPDADIMVVSRMHNSRNYQQMIEDALRDVGISPESCYFTAALKCRNFDRKAGASHVKACREYLLGEIGIVKPKWILALGNEALQSLTGRSGIMKYRSKPMDKGDYTVIATTSPAAVMRNPGQRAGWLSDIRFFASQVFGLEAKVGKPKVLFVNTKEKYQQLKRILERTEALAYDIETNNIDEFQQRAAIVSLAGTSLTREGHTICWAIPLSHPQSPFRKNWRQALRGLAPAFEAIPKQIGQNAKFDARWLRHFGIQAKVTYDTMLAFHLLNENESKGLKPQATSRLGVEAWAIETKDLYNTPLREVLVYNALDTWYDYHLYLETKAELIKQPRLLRLLKLMLLPANELMIEAERRGIWVDSERLSTNTVIAEQMRGELNAELMAHVPTPPHETKECELCQAGEHEIAEDWPVDSKGRPREVNFNASIFARWFLFEYLGLPVLKRGKEKDDGSEGMPSMAEDVMLELKGHPVVDLLLERAKWQKYCTAFLPAYREMMDKDDRIHTTFKLAGTVTGRLSSGKADAEKITARVNIRGVNIQQVPRDPFIRGLFGAAPGYAFVECDFSQVELRAIAHVARERTMLHLYRTGQDIHRATAAWVLGVPPSEVTKDDRKKAKAVNFGFAYGMGAAKFVYTAFTKYGVTFTLDEAQDIRKAFFAQFKGLLPWHARQRRLVAQHGRVQSPLGRIRHLPDIYSGDHKVRAEAERQAINSPIQAFASDMNLIAMTLADRKFKEDGIEAHVLGTIHDATLFEVRREHLREALPLIKHTFENLPLRRMFGLTLSVPIVADIKVGTHWGEAVELSEDQVYNFDKETRKLCLG